MGDMITVLVTDPSSSHTVAAMQSLGRAGYRIVTVSATHKFLRAFGTYSKYCSAHKKVPSFSSGEEHIDAVIDFATKQKVDVILPISSTSCTLYSKHCDRFRKVGIRVPITPWKEGMRIASSKKLTFEFAKSVNLPIPKTIYYNREDSFESVKKNLTFPVVIKGPEGANVRYANNDEELADNIRYFKETFPGGNLLIQEYIEGNGHGYYALCKEGKVLCQFMHKRVKEYPITGGPSVVAQSFYDRDLESLGRNFVSSLRWTGVCMVEFKHDKKDGVYKLMEMNPKFWGSLILSIKSGVNFPVYAVRMAMCEDFEPVLKYRQNLFCHWPFPGEISLIVGFPSEVLSILKILITEKNVINLSLSDPIPSFLQICFGSGSVLKKIWQRKLRYPHGKPLLP
ncbi:MAG: hypothetical protein DRI74_05895 [Bacteroidetes bacterium]|nr:MAG: hypothetical protein DRI74_05895 [Bacteroidota bacterium]